ncbi:MAG: S8 family peptidase, partial [Candidatus Paceibacterota bacterium]
MKKLLLFFFISSQVLSAQNHDPRDDQFNYAPGQVIVKLKDHVDAEITYKKNGTGTSQRDIGMLLGIGDKVAKSSVLFSEQTILKSIEMKKALIKDPRLPDPHSLKNTFILELKDKTENILGLVENIKDHPDIEYAEPDYYYSVNDFTIDSDILSEAELNSYINSKGSTTPDDPLYSQQDNITATKIDQVWDTYTTGNGSQILAILDTGIDYEHPDLKDNIWINEAELNGVEGYDDDGNGYIDDIRGWDFINQDNAPLDDNMHGTHVAGIAGAVGNNGIGIAGAAWNVKLMPIKVFQSNGVGNASTIALGVEYATNNGATILNMSFGSYAESLTLRNALENAYASSVLIAAAGNDGLCIGPGLCPDKMLGAPSYPAAYTYVIGVEDYPKPKSGYTNYDQDGPIFSSYSSLLNYEVTAPGTFILSTVPNGGYRTLTGTSMASPLVAGGIALYLQQNPEDSKELLFGNLINTSSTFFDIYSAIDVVPTPKLSVLSATTVDTINGQNGNGYLEPNETIEIFPLIKNYWGPSDDVRVGIEFAEFEDTTKATILTNEIAIGSLTAYATLQNLNNSLKIKIADGVIDNVNIKFNLKVWSGANFEFLSSTDFIINVVNGIELGGYYTDNLYLSANHIYIGTQSIVIGENDTLFLEPGVKLLMGNEKGINVLGTIIALGTVDSLIYFSPRDINWGGIMFSKGMVEYSVFEGISTKRIIAEGTNATFANCIFRSNFGSEYFYPSGSSIFDRTNIYENIGTFNYSFQSIFLKNSNVVNNYEIISPFQVSQGNDNFIASNIFNNFNYNIKGSWGADRVATLDGRTYFGSNSLETINSCIYDFFVDNSRGIVNIENWAQKADSIAHGIVWKVLINGIDAQDEYDLMDPIGVGTHQFNVYFNRAMDTTYIPRISYGVREPYTQKIISEKGTWSADSTIYSVSHEVKIGAADGINRIRVQDARDPDLFEIPIEDYRFNMLVQSAGSASAGFAAT